LPLVIADDYGVMIAYYLQNCDPDWDGTTVRILDHVSSDEPVAIVTCVCESFTVRKSRGSIHSAGILMLEGLLEGK
jgi:hypothetical protein